MAAEEQNEKILDFLKTHVLGVVSTIDSKNDKPESAVVAFSETEKLELIFGTFNDTRKFENIKNNPRVAFVIGWGDATVQYEGVAEIADGTEAEKLRSIHLTKNPKSEKYAFHEKQRFIKVSPRWIRYADLSLDPENVFEIQF